MNFPRAEIVRALELCFDRRYATRLVLFFIRGLKSTATVTLSPRDWIPQN